ncbi:PEP-CTERM motif protein [Pseudodesulfovibrio hydrargyri]|uniref:PEP-CTERM motif protein n=1 Tax=Pseudodesulfovibrio hydrargyri TaxID=2125990 RepID=A0A1J5ND94_9BACT|nr:choice-of-anchor A family protein [Pseudodesulfovibrio hydrargyri]OIQ49681.1 PEP-CTERM motif protein [Pseudodesulfovibrio hydrargyri]
MKYTYILFTLLALVLAASPARASYIDLGVAGEYNAFILGDFTSNSSDTQGNLAVGGNAVMSSYSIGGSVVVGNDFTLTDGSIGGDVVVGGTANLTRVGTGSRSIGGHATLPFDFDAAAAYLKNLSLTLSGTGANGTVGDNSGVLTLNGNNSSGLQVFNIDGSTLLNANTLYFNQIADDATILINVSGDLSGLTSMGLLYPGEFSDNVLFNFFEADTLLLDGVGVRGSILAPHARVTGASGEYSGWGNIDGTLIASSYNAHIEQHDVPFDGGTPVPEPGTFLFTGLGLLGLAGFMRRSKRRNKA